MITLTEVSLDIFDSGWQDLLGFDFYSGSALSFKPQCRRIGKIIYFRGILFVPLDNPLSSGTLVNLTSGNDYVTIQGCSPFVGSPNGVTLNANGSLVINNDLPIIPTSVWSGATLDGSGRSYRSNYIVGQRVVSLNPPTNNISTMLNASLNLILTDGKKLIVQTIKDGELASGYSSHTGGSPLRFITSNVKSGQYLPNYIDADTRIQGSTTLGTFNLVSDIHTAQFQFDCDAGKETDIGGFNLDISSLVAFTN